MKSNEKRATFAGGCFWCVEADFEKLPGVIRAISGYAGGEKENPTYNEVSSGATGHLETVQVVYDPERIGYEDLLDHFWRHVNPTDAGGQFVDRGGQYATAIFYHDEEQKRLAEESKERLDASGVFQNPVVTPIRPLENFYPAEDYHQDYYRTHSFRYKLYRYGSGRDKFLEKTWEGREETAPGNETSGGEASDWRNFVKPQADELRARLTPLQYKVTQKEGTEPPFDNPHHDNKRPGIYVDVVSGEPLFSSLDKYDSGTGWPSFTEPLEPENIVEREDRSLFSVRTEVRSRHADSHLGHVFPDGPPPTGRRYCMNSAALRFIPAEDLESEGYGEYLHLFQKRDAEAHP